MKLVPLSELFEVVYGHQLDLNKMQRTSDPDGVAFVNRTARHNGVVATVKRIDAVAPSPAGVLTIALGGSVLSTFLQIKPFYTGQNVAVATPRQPMSSAQLLYYAAAIKANAFRYSTCGREANRTFRSIMVPALEALPAWVSDANPEKFSGKDAPAQPAASVPALTPATWAAFSLGELFRLRKGKRLTKANSTRGRVPFIGAIDRNNGVRQTIGNTSHLHSGGTITVNYNGSVGEAFYQPEPFWASDDVNVLYPKFPMTPAVALFICAVIRQERYRYNYGRKWHLERMTETTIRLPANAAGEPDLAFMEAYVRALPYSSQVDGPPLVTTEQSRAAAD